MRRTLLLISAALPLAACATQGGARLDAASPDAAAPPQFHAADIAGKTGEDLDRLLGAPALTRVEGAGEFRRYALTDCALLVVLYPDDKGEKRAASLSAGALKSGDAAPDLDLCLARGKQATP